MTCMSSDPHGGAVDGSTWMNSRLLPYHRSGTKSTLKRRYGTWFHHGTVHDYASNSVDCVGHDMLPNSQENSRTSLTESWGKPEQYVQMINTCNRGRDAKTSSSRCECLQS